MYSLSSVRDCFIKSNSIKLRMDAVIKEYYSLKAVDFVKESKKLFEVREKNNEQYCNQ
jgi:hypothetical protein